MATSIQADVASFGRLEVRDLSYVEASISAAQTTNIGVGDHIKFDVARVSAGSLITLDTTTTYVNTQNTASVGRFTLVGGRVYEIALRPTWAGWSGAAGSTCNLGIYDNDSNALIGQTSYLPPSTETSNNTGDGTLSAFYAPTATVRIEFRLVSATALTAIGTVATYNYFPTVLIKNLR